MKKLFFAFIICALCACGSSKKKTENKGNGTSLDQRLSEFMQVNDEMNLEKVMDYIYPKLFTIVPREEMLEAMKSGFNNEEVKVELDSLKIDRVNPEFEMAQGRYAKISYSMVMLMDFKISKDSIDTNGPRMVEMLAAEYGEENVSLDKATGIIRIRTSSPMVAVKDEYAKEWSFVNLKEEDPLVNKLFSKEVLDKLATYQ
ncbi:MAG: hypothetical protein H7Y01_08635 [Ferruginibacter sp.]|nr:hypothetical protein [Chitinophagaceae bacterium]